MIYNDEIFKIDEKITDDIISMRFEREFIRLNKNIKDIDDLENCKLGIIRKNKIDILKMNEIK